MKITEGKRKERAEIFAACTCHPDAKRGQRCTRGGWIRCEGSLHKWQDLQFQKPQPDPKKETAPASPKKSIDPDRLILMGIAQGPTQGVVPAGTEAAFSLVMDPKLFSQLGIDAIAFRQLILHGAATALEVTDLSVNGIETLFEDPTFEWKGEAFSNIVKFPVPIRGVPAHAGQAVVVKVRNPTRHSVTFVGSLKGETDRIPKGRADGRSKASP